MNPVSFSHYEFAVLLALISSFSIGIFCLVWGWNRPLSRVFGFYNLVITGWAYCWYQTITSTDSARGLFFDRLLHIPTSFIPAFFLLFVQLLLVNTSDNTQRLLKRAFFISGALFASLSFHPNYVASAIPKMGFRMYPEPGSLYIAFTLWFTATVIIILAILLKALANTKGEKRNQIAYVLLAYTLGYVGGTMTFLPAYNIPMPAWGLYLIPLGQILVLYTIVAHRLLNLRLFIRRASLLIGIYAGLILITIPLFYFLHARIIAMTIFDYRIFYTEALLLGGVFALAPFLYAYFVQKGSYFHEHTMAGITHELKSPLATIESALEVLVENLKKDTKNIANIEYAEMIHRNAQRLGAYVNDLLNVFRVKNKKLLLEYANVNLRELCEKIVDELNPLAAKQNSKIVLKSSEAIANCDPKKISQVLSNLISNAVKFTENGTITVSVSEHNRQIECSVLDTGEGMTPNEIPHIFDRFFQGTAGKRGKGTGLGLAISKLWVEAHGGEIHAESDGPGKGSKFWFTIPK
jgi:signal transduction histidine kinase